MKMEAKTKKKRAKMDKLDLKKLFRVRDAFLKVFMVCGEKYKY